MEDIIFNGKKVQPGKQRSIRVEPAYRLYKLVGASPPVTVEERVYSNKSTFYVQASITRKTVRGRVLKNGRKTRTRYIQSRHTGFGTSLPLALKKLEKNMAFEFKALASALGYELID